jgi:hypothetical protein
MFNKDLDCSEQLQNYKSFCACKINYGLTNKLDLSEYSFFYPGLIVPIGILMQNNSITDFVNPNNNAAAGYFKYMLSADIIDPLNKTYLPIVALPAEEKESTFVLENIFVLCDNGKNCGGESQFKSFLDELIVNIYEHSEFTSAYVMAQQYSKQGFIEICIVDNGISIPGSLKKFGAHFENDCEHICCAINGYSTKGPERGYGLGSTVKWCKNYFRGELLIISGAGAIFVDSDGKQKLYKLEPAHIFEGTYINIRLPFPNETEDSDLFYECIK